GIYLAELWHQVRQRQFKFLLGYPGLAAAPLRIARRRLGGA
ncbi:MAG: hypothetical protein JWO31_3389, partial [Phycisphaerales bacterium]|nr:hypothetical protein [Phycisphaerales bacterium]